MAKTLVQIATEKLNTAHKNVVSIVDTVQNSLDIVAELDAQITEKKEQIVGLTAQFEEALSKEQDILAHNMKVNTKETIINYLEDNQDKTIITKEELNALKQANNTLKATIVSNQDSKEEAINKAVSEAEERFTLRTKAEDNKKDATIASLEAELRSKEQVIEQLKETLNSQSKTFIAVAEANTPKATPSQNN